MSDLKKLVYVSQSRLAAANAERAVADIEALATVRNRRLEIGGALLFTGHRFAQWLEGPSANVDLLMKSIRRDPRHGAVCVVAEGAIATRAFPDWGLAHCGPSLFVDRHLKAAMAICADGMSDPRAVAQLERLILELAEPVGAR